MSWSWKLGRFFGIPVYVHWTFLILLAYVGYVHWVQSDGDTRATAEGVATILAIFGCVVLHEFGHALMARRFGVPTTDITLLPIGGVARLTRIPENPTQELLIALAGPAVNVAIAAIVALALSLGGGSVGPIFDAGFLRRDLPFAQDLLRVNLFLVAFNLIPAFPMDGGRVLRALLAMSMPYARATRSAASVGQMIAIAFGFFGLTSGNPMLLLIALFVWMGAEAEARSAEERAGLGGATVREAMLTDYETLEARDPLARAVDLLLAGSQADFPVRDGGGAVVGVLTRDALLRGLASAGRDSPTADHMTEGLESVDAASDLAPAVTRLRESAAPCLQVLDRDRPVGLLTLENVAEYLMVRSALSLATATSPTPARRA